MRCLANLGPARTVMFALLTLFATTTTTAFAQSPVKLKKFHVSVDMSGGEPFPFILNGKASHLGKFKAYGEIEFVPGEETGTLVGTGVVVFKAANGDLLVGIVTWEVGPMVDAQGTSRIHFAWRDSVEFDDGTVAVNTGRFVDSRPPGLVVAARCRLVCFLGFCFLVCD